MSDDKTRIVEDQPTPGAIPWTDDMNLIHRNPARFSADTALEWLENYMPNNGQWRIRICKAISGTVWVDAKGNIYRGDTLLLAIKAAMEAENAKK